MPVSLALPFDGQPQEAVDVDWSNPLTAGLQYVQAGDQPASIVGAPFTVLAGVGRATATRGVGLSYDGVSGTRAIATQPGVSSTGTMLTFFQIPDAALAVSRVIFSLCNVGASGDSSHPAHYVFFDTATQKFGATSCDAFNWADALGSTITAGGDYLLAARFEYGGGRDFWQNGVFGGSNATARSPLGLDTFVFGAYRTGGAEMLGTTYLNCWWGRLLTDDEIRSVSANPWQLFRAPPVVVARYRWTRLVPASTLANVGWTPSSGTAHGALSAIGGARITTATPGASTIVSLG